MTAHGPQRTTDTPRSSGLLPLVLVAALLPACASSSEDPQAPAPQSTRVQTNLRTQQGMLTFEVDDYTQAAPIPGTPEDSFPVLLTLYEQMELGPGRVEPSTFEVGHPALTVSRRIDGERMSRLFNCGSNMTGPLADQSRLTLTLTSQLTSEGDQTMLRTRIEAYAVPNDGAGNRINCTSNGRLEERIHSRLVAVLIGVGP